MTQEIEDYIGKYPEEIVQLFMKIRDVVFSIEDILIEEKLWAKLPSYYHGDRFVSIIPFKDHINIEAVNFNGNNLSETAFIVKGNMAISDIKVRL